jgi:hypothetical protein
MPGNHGLFVIIAVDNAAVSGVTDQRDGQSRALSWSYCKIKADICCCATFLIIRFLYSSFVANNSPARPYSRRANHQDPDTCPFSQPQGLPKNKPSPIICGVRFHRKRSFSPADSTDSSSDSGGDRYHNVYPLRAFHRHTFILIYPSNSQV